MQGCRVTAQYWAQHGKKRVKKKCAARRGRLARPPECCVVAGQTWRQSQGSKDEQVFFRGVRGVRDIAAREKNKYNGHEGAWYLFKMAASSGFPGCDKRSGENAGDAP